MESVYEINGSNENVVDIAELILILLCCAMHCILISLIPVLENKTHESG